jgi:ribulose-5-phosphate 4-epimerase/fuculose-1-phosphate aldolase
MSAAFKTSVSDMNDAEWETRCELAAVYHLMDHLGWTDLINTHMSARLPGEPNHFLINDYGDMFNEITATSLFKLDMDGNAIGSADGKFNAAGFTTHSAVKKGRRDAKLTEKYTPMTQGTRLHHKA